MGDLGSESVLLMIAGTEIEGGYGGGLRAELVGIEKKLLALVQSLALQSDAGQVD